MYVFCGFRLLPQRDCFFVFFTSLVMSHAYANMDTIDNDRFSWGGESYPWSISESKMFAKRNCRHESYCYHSIEYILGIPVEQVSIKFYGSSRSHVENVYSTVKSEVGTQSVDFFISKLYEKLGPPTKKFEVEDYSKKSSYSSNRVGPLQKMLSLVEGSKHRAAVWRLGDVDVFLRSYMDNYQKKTYKVNLILQYSNRVKALEKTRGNLTLINKRYDRLASSIESMKIYERKREQEYFSKDWISGYSVEKKDDDQWLQADKILKTDNAFFTPSSIAQQLNNLKVAVWIPRDNSELVISHRLTSVALPLLKEVQIRCAKLYPARGKGRMSIKFVDLESSKILAAISDAYDSPGLREILQYSEQLLGRKSECSEQPDS